MKKIMSKSDENEFFDQIISFAVEKKITLSQFKKIEAKVHEFYEDNACLDFALADKRFVHKNSSKKTSNLHESESLSESRVMKDPYQSSKI